MTQPEAALRWHSPEQQPFRINGLPWHEQEGTYRRIARSDERAVTEKVRQFAACPSGGQIRFRTDSTRLSIRVRLSGPPKLNNMPATSECGFDCYIDVEDERLFRSASRYDHSRTDYEMPLYSGMDKQLRTITLYFPLYQGVEEVWIGLDPDAVVADPPSYASDKRVVIYGTSITQGAAAARPGMSYPNILSRRFPLEFINMGFSGSGRGEPEMAAIVARIERPACFIMDYEANCPNVAHMERTLSPFLRIYREAHPDVPILVLSKIRYAQELFDDELIEKRLRMQAIQQETVERMRREGERRIYFQDGSGLLGSRFHECTVDGVHPTDLGFMKMADGLTPVLRDLLQVGKVKF